jgi:hypothetical protein
MGMKQKQYRRMARGMLQREVASQVLKSFNHAHVPVIVLKGMALAGRVYSDATERSMHDIDLLVRRSDWQEAVEILTDHGFTFDEQAGEWTEAFSREFMGETPYRRQAVVIDLHWHLTPMAWYRRTTNFDMKGIWDRAISTEIGGAQAHRLSPEDELIHLCYHNAIHHGLAHQQSCRDIMGLIHLEGANLNWQVIGARARKWRVGTATWAALKVVSQIDTQVVLEEAFHKFKVAVWQKVLLLPIIKRAGKGKPVLVSGSMRFLNILLIDRILDLPVVLGYGLFPGRRWLQLRYDLSRREAFWRQFVYPFEVGWRGIEAVFS